MVKEDYAQWLLDDPRINLTLERSAATPGLSHAGIQVESEAELGDVKRQMSAAAMPYLEEGTTTCCYHKSDKSWTHDPDGLPWEAFFTHHETEHRGDSNVEIPVETQPGNVMQSDASPARCC